MTGEGLHLVVHGARAAGLVAACCAVRAGADWRRVPDALQPTTSDADPPAVMTLPPSATRVLYALGLRRALDAAAAEPRHLRLRARRGGLVATLALGAHSRERHGAPCLNLRAERFAELLGEALARPRAPAPAHPNPAGNAVHALARVAPPGSGSRWSLRVPLAEVPPQLRRPDLQVWAVPGGHVRTLLLDPDGARHPELQVEFVTVAVAPAGSRAADAADWPAELRPCAEQAQRCNPPPVTAAPPDAGLGAATPPAAVDLCAATAGVPSLPWFAEAATIENAWVLGRLLESRDGDAGRVVADWRRYRDPRNARLRVLAEAWAGLLHLDDPGAIRARNLRIGLVSRLAPESVQLQLDLLHDYDAVRGFQ